MGANDGAVLAFRQLVNNGANNRRYNIVLVSEGYTEAEIPLFQDHCKSFLRTLFWTTPFDTLRCTFNVFALEVSSTESGIDDPMKCAPGTGVSVATYFDATMCGDGKTHRVVKIDSGAVRNRVAGFLPQANSILVLVNSNLHGGAQGDVAVFTTESGWETTALHEWGHVMGLADEYDCYVCNGTDDGRTYNWFDSIVNGYGLPNEPNVSNTSNLSQLKWAALVAPGTPVPTAPGTVPAGTVGAFAGAKYYAAGLFRPEESCRMRAPGPFCAVCRAAIVSYLTPWTPTTACITPTATPPTLTVNARIHGKVMLAPGRGGYAATLDTVTDLPGTPALTYRLDGQAWTNLPAPPTIQVPVNGTLGTFIYNHTVEVRGAVKVAELDYWVPETSTFMSAAGSDPVALRQPNNAANVLVSDYDNPGNVEGAGFASIDFGAIKAGNGWLYVGRRKYYTRLAARLRLDDGYFGPDDDPGWALHNVTWSPTPTQSSGLTAFFDVTFSSSGLCWLNSDPSKVVDPNVGFQVTAQGKDAIGQSFGATGTLAPTHVEYVRSISTIERERIPEWEWPMRFDIREKILEVIHEGVLVTFDGMVLQIGDIKVEVEEARHG